MDVAAIIAGVILLLIGIYVTPGIPDLEIAGALLIAGGLASEK